MTTAVVTQEDNDQNNDDTSSIAKRSIFAFIYDTTTTKVTQE